MGMRGVRKGRAIHAHVHGRFCNVGYLGGMPRKKKTGAADDPRSPERVFGEIVRERRITLGLTQSDLEAEDVLDQTHISRIEAGKTQICLRGILQIAEALETTPEDLMGELRRKLS